METSKRAKNLTIIGVVTCLLCLTCAVAHSQTYPTAPIQMFVGYAPGGLVDAIARTVAKQMESVLKQPVVVVNKPGAGGSLMVQQVKTAKPDGYTVGFTTGVTYTYNPLAQKVDYTVDDQKYVAAVTQMQEAFVSGSDRPWKDFKGLVEYSKKHPGLSYASQNPIADAILDSIAKKEGVDWIAVPVKGGAETITAILGKHVDFGFSGGVHTPHVKAGKMIVLCALGEKRLLANPNVPTLAELGYNIQFATYNIISVPKSTPDNVVKILSSAVEKAMKDPATVDVLQNKMEVPAVYLGPEATEKHIKQQSTMMKGLIKN
jgi:tripartite-type tricarboxylate transporter receptor subunit TctC